MRTDWTIAKTLAGGVADGRGPVRDVAVRYRRGCRVSRGPSLDAYHLGLRERAAASRCTGPERPVVTAVRPERPGDPAVPFIGLAEAYALAAFRHAGVPMQRIRPAIDTLARELGLEHALASRRL